MRVGSFLRSLVLAGAVLHASPASADLIILDGGMVYDSVQNLTWVRDPWLARTTGADADGLMTYETALDWAADLEYGGYSDWRLPQLTGIGTGVNSSSEISSLLYSAGWHWEGFDLIGGSSPFNLSFGPFWLDTNSLAQCTGCYWWTPTQDVDFADGRLLASPWVVREGQPSSVPEPSTLILMGLGAAVVAVRRRLSTRA